MATDVTIPRLGWSMEEGTLTEWLKQDGDSVRKGDVLFVLEGDKATQEIESFEEGVLHRLPDGPKAGDTVKVGQVVAILLAPGEAPPVARPSTPESLSTAATAKSAGAGTMAAAAVVGLSGQALADKAQPSEARAGGRAGRWPRSSPRSSPRARRRAAELGIDWTALPGGGASGRVREADVLAAAAQQQPAHQPQQPQKQQPGAREQRTPLSATRRTIAQRMVESHRTAAPVTLTTTVDATNLVSLRRQFQLASHSATSPGPVVPSYVDLIVKLAALALVDHPKLNARWEEDAIVTFSEVHMGIAVDTDAGLVVAVIRGTQRLGVREIAARSKDLIERARVRSLQPDEMQGGTFTVSNLGPYGVDAFTPILNGPQCAILGLGRIHAQPAVVDGQIVAREMMAVSLTFDHRLVDGVPAARFLQTLCAGIENPAARLIE